MRSPHVLFVLLLSTLSFTVSAKGQIAQDQIQVTTPAAPWTLVFDGKRLSLRDVKIKPGEGSGYFLMVDESSEVNFSLYIEPVDKCKTSDECRDYILGFGNPGWGKYQDLAKGRVGSFSYFEFFRPEVQGLPLQMLDMYAQFVEKGYWIDLHISKAVYKKEEHILFENLIKGIKFVPKDAKPASEPVREKIETAATGWLQNWDAIKCKETYAALTSLSNEAVTEPQWTPYCQEIHKNLGKLQSRKLIASSL
ncbi:MAG TPA: DUF4019 domain-containing protein, partial [Pyrinomonadaceae bacterium]|nr:DUF4019 domain-containing protein [Pyrinomonadaceae bacterium]